MMMSRNGEDELRDATVLHGQLVDTIQTLRKGNFLPRDLKSKLAKEEARLDALLSDLQQAKAQRSYAVQKALMLQRACGSLGEKLCSMQVTMVPRPIDLCHLPHDARPQEAICLEAIPNPCTWDLVWIDRIRALNPLDFTLLHRQHMLSLQPMVTLVSSGGVQTYA